MAKPPRKAVPSSMVAINHLPTSEATSPHLPKNRSMLESNNSKTSTHKGLEANAKLNTCINYLNFGKTAPKGSTLKHCGY
ncbi:MAG: hypothetical protein HWD63_05370 [Candidatus Parvibacillus calidus]|nr:MAG: hypothetical protein HWD63_05370 [Candidatus Parvibacillus calidus]